MKERKIMYNKSLMGPLIKSIHKLEEAKIQYLLKEENRDKLIKFINLPFSEKEVIVDKRIYKDYIHDKEKKYALESMDMNFIKIFLKKFIMPSKGFFPSSINRIAKQLRDILIALSFGQINSIIITKIPVNMRRDEVTLIFLEELMISIYKYDTDSNAQFSTFLHTRLTGTVNKIFQSTLFQEKSGGNLFYGTEFPTFKSKELKAAFEEFGIYDDLIEFSPGLVDNLKNETIYFSTFINRLILNRSFVSSKDKDFNISGIREVFFNRIKEICPKTYEKTIMEHSSVYTQARIFAEMVLQKNISVSFFDKKFDSKEEEVSYMDNYESLETEVNSILIQEVYKELLQKMLKEPKFKDKKLKNVNPGIKVTVLKDMLSVFKEQEVKATNDAIVVFNDEFKFINDFADGEAKQSKELRAYMLKILKKPVIREILTFSHFI